MIKKTSLILSWECFYNKINKIKPLAITITFKILNQLANKVTNSYLIAIKHVCIVKDFKIIGQKDYI